jgi:3-methylcrotonyl-CoA carboxylase alpha subunit
MEMNTRLQVEHPVTEMITGQDLVQWQLKVAAGEALPCSQEQLAISGHAIEARIYAEDPARDFLPSIGDLRHLRTPCESAHVRIDTGVRQGDSVSIHYDPMIAKLIVWDATRAGALRRLRSALAEYQVVGVTTNIEFLASVAAHPAFAAGDFDTGFIERHRAVLFPDTAPVSDRVLALASLHVLLQRSAEADRAASVSRDRWSPWNLTTGWQMNGDNHHVLTLRDGDSAVCVTAHYRADGFLLDLPGGWLQVRGKLEGDGNLLADLDGTRVTATVICHGAELTVISNGSSHRLTLHDPLAHAGEQEVEGGRLTAPMPGKIVALLVQPGAVVERGAPLVILEAMKMEHTITAPRDGVVAEIHFAVGAVVNEGAELLAFALDVEQL